jgi:hypothetical protein
VKAQAAAFFRKPIARKIRLAALIFALLFTATALAQYLFLSGQIKKTTESEFTYWTKEIKGQLNYQGKWDVT